MFAADSQSDVVTEAGLRLPGAIEATVSAAPVPAPARPHRPWLSIWFRPRSTMRAILDWNPTDGLFSLVLSATGTTTLGDSVISRLEGGEGSFGTWSLWLSVVVAWIGIYVWAWLMGWTGRRLGGTGNNTEIRAAVVWSMVPTIALGIPYLLQVGAILVLPTAPLLAALLSVLAGILFVLLPFWGIMLELKCIAEAHRFSAWRALGATILAIVLVVLALVPVGLLVALVVSALGGTSL